MKYYAVKEGRQRGIFHTWDECKKQVQGYSGALYKSFTSKEDAENYLNPEEKVTASVDPTKVIEVYVDGSFEKNSGVYSYGCVLLTSDKQSLSGAGADPKYAALRNVAGELMGSMRAIEWAIEKDYKEIVIYHDYTGIANWATGEWQARNEVTQEYVAFLKKHAGEIQVKFQKVRAHTGVAHNEEADQLAKKALKDYEERAHR